MPPSPTMLTTTILSLLVPFSLATAIRSSQAPLIANDGVNYLFVFGNSYTSVGFNPDWGQPRPGNPIGNPTFPGSNLAGGKNWIGYLTVDYNASLTFTYDFAFNCATVSADLVPTCGPGVRTLVDQVAEWEELESGVVQHGRWEGDNSLFAFWFGINDVDLPTYWDGVDHDKLHEAVINRYFAELERLYAHGARKMLIMGVPSIERTPRVRDKPEDGQRLEKRLYNDFNVRLYRREKRFREEHEDVSIVLIDTALLFNQVLDHPEEFGARDEFCFGGYDEGCIWADNFHPGRILHEFIARNVVKELEGRIDGFFQQTW